MNPLVKFSENLHFFIRNTDFFCFSWDSILMVTQSLNENINWFMFLSFYRIQFFCYKKMLRENVKKIKFQQGKLIWFEIFMFSSNPFTFLDFCLLLTYWNYQSSYLTSKWWLISFRGEYKTENWNLTFSLHK